MLVRHILLTFSLSQMTNCVRDPYNNTSVIIPRWHLLLRCSAAKTPPSPQKCYTDICYNSMLVHCNNDIFVNEEKVKSNTKANTYNETRKQTPKKTHRHRHRHRHTDTHARARARTRMHIHVNTWSRAHIYSHEICKGTRNRHKLNIKKRWQGEHCLGTASDKTTYGGFNMFKGLSNLTPVNSTLVERTV